MKKKQFQETQSGELVELLERRTPSALEVAVNRKGIRAKNLLLALSDIGEMRSQRPAIAKPTVLIESAEIVGESRTSAKDMALTEALLAIARDVNITKPYHEVRASVLLDYLGITSVDRLVDSLTRIQSTSVKYDVRDFTAKKRYRRAVSLIQFMIESDLAGPKASKAIRDKIERGSSILRFSVPEVVREVFVLPKPYTWINLCSVSQFKNKYSNGLYQLLAVKAGHDQRYRTPLVISAQDLAIKLGWSHARAKPFNAALFLQRVVKPALEDIRACVEEFDVIFDEPERDSSKHGRPLEDLKFWVLVKQNHLLSSSALKGKKRQKVGTQLRTRVTLPDSIHPQEWLPSIDAISRVSHQLREANPFSLGRIAGENRRRPMTLALAWRTTLDAIVANPDVQVSVDLTGHDILSALDNPYIGVDRIFEQWALSHRMGLSYLGVPVRTSIKPLPTPQRLPPEKMFLHPVSYGSLARMESYANDLQVYKNDNGLYSHQTLVEAFANLDHVWRAISNAAPAYVKLGGLTKAMAMMSKAHPVRMRHTAKNIVEAVWSEDFEKIEKIMKAIFANEKKLFGHPVTGERYKDPTPKSENSFAFMPITEGEAEAMATGTGALTNFG
ncbi:replication initiation protein [Peteryoungia algae]|uniref:Replication initiation protein n=1 Tax=Peteryoungia algae TaxID=2919917 RepID=A0ABT0CXC1_9HYPH|nr:replication initiation protein [Rhizobium sp. SSM4.3]MCJ8237817.1 replication initiation protein [Rhizobium sp. SSM4.3]